ncbi:DUF6286 domain-containing protein [Arthrobacter sp. H14]|uniref:DUF6286 domain-containing protein n=1 Tax=Arthrobacter sp. H14 TaxID=1312959 RepID=UPI00047DB4D2|nr:DUF6286 domain-containing protein [Arthrobacter sp. H14]
MSKTSRSKSLRRRPSRALAASIVAIILLAVGSAAAWISIERLSTGAWPGYLSPATRWLTSLSWNSVGLWATAIVLAVIGVSLLLTALVPGKFNGIRLQAGHEDRDRVTEVLLSNRALTRLATAHADQIDGVTSSKATSKGRRVHLRVTSPLRQPGDLRRRVADAVSERLQSTAPMTNPKVGVNVRSTDD